MLPKVASQILQHTSRAVAVVQGQTGHTIRNVLQTGPTNIGQWNGPGSSSSGWNGSGPSSGGAKFHSSSSRFHSSYTGAGRAVSQADASASYSDTVDTSDDGFELLSSKDDPISLRAERRVRSSSMSFTLQTQKDPEARSVLKAIKHHVRARHAFAVPGEASCAEPASIEPILLTDTPTSSFTPDCPSPRIDECAAIIAAKDANDVKAVAREAASLRALPKASVRVYNTILDAMRAVRPAGTPLDDILEVYNELIARSLHPTVRTYAILANTLAIRDHEVCQGIKQLETDLARLRLLGSSPNHLKRFEARLQQLRSENNFNSALTLFKTAFTFRAAGEILDGPGGTTEHSIYSALLRACVYRADVESARYIFSQWKQDVTDSRRISAVPFREMIGVHVAAGDVEGARQIFEEYENNARKHRFHWSTRASDLSQQRGIHMVIYNSMIKGYIKCGQPEKGLKLLERMMDSEADAEFGPTDVPPPSPSTFTDIVTGFLQSGDTTSAVIWFDRLLQQNDSPASALGPTSVPTKPQASLWTQMFMQLASSGMIDDLNRLLKKALDENVFISSTYAMLALKVNLDYIDAHPEMDQAAAVDNIAFFANTLHPRFRDLWRVDEGVIGLTVFQRVIGTYLRLNQTDLAVALLETYIQKAWSALATAEKDGVAAENTQFKVKGLRKVIQSLTPLFVKQEAVSLTLDQALDFALLSAKVHIFPTTGVSQHYLRLYNQFRGELQDAPLTKAKWEMLFYAVLSVERDTSVAAGNDLPTLEILLRDSATSCNVISLPQRVKRQITEALLRKYSREEAWTFLSSVSAKATSLLEGVDADSRVNIPEETAAPTPQSPEIPLAPHVHIDEYHSKFIDDSYTSHSPASVMTGFRRFEAGLKTGVYPTPEVIGRLINAVGRQGELEKVRRLYDAAQTVLSSLSHDVQYQSLGWFQVEDQMIIALAHAGETQAAHVHRNRILAQGGTPSADAYAALIQRVKDTTDDTANAMTLFEEARSRGVSPNIFLYNTIISKLAKARKVDFALELFQEMKAAGFRPTSVTYGAVIAACCRVGDAQSAEILFEEMSSQPNFKPRVPPFNTMMQLYTHTKPDRERVMYYASALRRAKVPFTAHTYKLLLDAYGTIEPLDLSAMEDTMNTLVSDKSTRVHGTHWAALINAYGCASKDLDKAVSVFESIASHPSSSNGMPDAICYEALLNVLVTLKRTDMIPQYTDRMSTHSIHMTAYIANLVIKGYAGAGNIEQARAVFESLVDPPEGVAAPNNHAAYDITSQNVPTDAPVFREPSTWETMIRAELGNGDRTLALDLLERLKARRFPPAVFSRISGILSTDPAFIWDGLGTPPSPQSASTE